MTAHLHRLSNGVRVVCDSMDGLQSLALSVVIHAGAIAEPPERNGWSHLLEHMVFKGAGDRSARAIVEAIEADGGHINAATGYERTSYQVRCLKGALPLAMAVIADLVRRPKLDAADLDREVAVIGQEIAEAADAPDDRVFEQAQAAAFTGQALGRPILGTDESIGRATPDTLSDHHRGLYALDRIVVSAAGAVDEDELLQLAEAEFGEPAPPCEPSAAVAPAFVGGDAIESRRLEQAHLVLLLPGVGARDPDYFAIRLFAEALGGGMSSRLFQKAREEKGLAYAIDAYAECYEEVGVLGVYAGTSAGDAAETARLAAAEIGALAAKPGEAEFARAKAQLKAHLFMGREAPLARAEQAAGQVCLFDRTVPPEDLARAIDAVGPDDFRRIGDRLLGGGRAVVSVLGPKRAGAAARAFRGAL